MVKIDLLNVAGVMMVVAIVIALFNASIAPGLLMAAFFIGIIGIIEKIVKWVRDGRK